MKHAIKKNFNFFYQKNITCLLKLNDNKTKTTEFLILLDCTK